jgi:hypothetical protein
VATGTVVSCNLSRQYGPMLSLSVLDVYGMYHGNVFVLIFDLVLHVLHNVYSGHWHNGTVPLKNVNNGLNTNIYSYLEISGGQTYNLYLNVVHFFNTSLN